ncbi:MAG: hypothetical protein AVDCRST_MAG25-2811 [uncultured Rubrobacteraceae bacterium]|uniref:Uncharacterized protein n=1 Tax=uncultured Rubrobacteraceae bacterium TaxID=349277 RepID=A0A6J4S047_9ACTN|nr:MAG: hypothetical protein AVDCRST_MAG25-2811 [uncultured Rubrobacteraceae bacterium]
MTTTILTDHGPIEASYAGGEAPGATIRADTTGDLSRLPSYRSGAV